MRIKKLLQHSFFIILGISGGLLPNSAARAHGGVSVEIDTCRIPIADQWVHFTGYTPTFTADQEYCNSIPDVGQTNLVFDYEGKLLRGMTVEFEITKEPEGTQIYYQPPKTHTTGTVNAAIDFNGFGTGSYLAHVTLVNDGKKIDAHLPFTVGMSFGEFLYVPVFGVLLAILGVGSMVYQSGGDFRRKVDRVLVNLGSTRYFGLGTLAPIRFAIKKTLTWVRKSNKFARPIILHCINIVGLLLRKLNIQTK